MDVDQLTRVDRLEHEVARLDREVERLKTRIGEVAVPVQQGLQPPMRPVALDERAAWPAPRPVADSHPALKPRPARLTVDSETVLKWGGVGLVVLAIGFAVSTAISRDWIGPELQLAGAVLVSAALVAAGLRLRSTRPGWTHALCSGGVAALFTTFASDLFLDRANEPVALAATSAVAAGGLMLARWICSEWVAAGTILGGSIGWAVIATGDAPPTTVTVLWFVALVAAVIWLSLERRWFAVRLLAHAIGMIAFLAVSEQITGAGESTLILLATLLLAGSLFVVPSIGDVRSVWQQLEIQLAALAAPWAFVVTLVAVLDERSDNVISAVAFAIAALTAAVARTPGGRLRRPHVVSLTLGASVTTSIGLAILLSTATVFVVLAVQAAGLVLLSRALGHNVRVLINAGVLGTIAVIRTVVVMVDAWSENASWGDDVAHLLVIGALSVGIWFGQRDFRRGGAITMLVLILLWVGSVLVHAPQGQAVVSIAWAVLGTGVFVAGAVRKRADAASTGLAVLALTVGKLLTVDLREVDTLWRAGLFFLVGIGLLRLGFLLPRLTRTDTAPAPMPAPMPASMPAPMPAPGRHDDHHDDQHDGRSVGPRQ